MKKKSFFVVLFSTIIILQGCKKYEDGPFLSLKSKTTRIVGYWNSEKFYIDDELQEGNGSIFYDIKENGDYNRVFENGTWKFNDKKEKLIFNSLNSSYEVIILRLTNDELWTSMTANDKTYKYHFAKQE